MPYDSDSESCGSSYPVQVSKISSIKQAALLSRRPRASLNEDRQNAHYRLINDYFAENPVYNDVCFRRRFRMRKHLFLRIVEALGNHSKYFELRHDDDGRRRYSPLMKCTAAMRILAFGSSSDVLDEYLQLGDKTEVECVKEFAQGVVDVFGEQYLRTPNEADIARLLGVGEARGFPGMLGSVDYMHWEWKDCPRTWRQVLNLKGSRKNLTLVAEVAASYDLWIWHAFFGNPSSWNNINLIERNPLYRELCRCHTLKCEYMVNHKKYDMGYYLTNGIYPQSAAFVKPIPHPGNDKAKLFAEHQETIRKDAKRAFEVLQTRFAIIGGPSQSYHKYVLAMIIRACIILHNMIIEDERDSGELANDFSYEQVEDSVPTPRFYRDHLAQYEGYIRFYVRSMEEGDEEVHQNLQADLVEEIWQHFGSRIPK